MNTVNTRKKFFPNVTDEEWNDWTCQVKNRIEKIDDLKKYVELSAEEEEGVVRTLETLRMAITPYYFSLIDLNSDRCPIRKGISKLLANHYCFKSSTKALSTIMDVAVVQEKT